ncbi:hypothetical protein OKHIF_26770 [Mycobacteroides chelonae]
MGPFDGLVDAGKARGASDAAIRSAAPHVWGRATVRALVPHIGIGVGLPDRTRGSAATAYRGHRGPTPVRFPVPKGTGENVIDARVIAVIACVIAWPAALDIA